MTGVGASGKRAAKVDVDMSDKPHHSPSSLGLWQKCQIAYEFRYLKGIKKPPGIAAIVGTGTHKSIEANLRAKMAGKVMSAQAAKEAAFDATAKAWDEHKPTPTEKDDVQSVGQAQDSAIALALLHHAKVAPGITPIGVEEKGELEPEGYDWSLLVYKDIIEAGRIRDTKTTGKKPDAEAADRGSYADQLTTYHMVGGEDCQVQLDFLVNTKVPYAHTLVGRTRTTNDHARLLDRYQRMHAQVQTGIFQPAPADSWQCSRRWCGYYDECPHGSGTVVPAKRLLKKWGTR